MIWVGVFNVLHPTNGDNQLPQTRVGFRSKRLVLEGVVSLPEGLSGQLPGAVICHPHPAFGGNMDHAMVVGLARALNEAGIASLRFNFRGVGDSEGTFSNGAEESQDLLAALEFLKIWPGVKGRKLALVGYSFGAAVILRGLRRYKAARALVLLSPPLSSVDDSSVARDRRPKLFLVGEIDRLVEAQRLQERLAACVVPAAVEVVPGADHSWMGREVEVAQRVARFLAQVV